MREAIRSVDPIQRSFELGQVINDAQRAYWKSRTLEEGMKRGQFWQRQETLDRRGVSLVFVSGLMTWQGSETLKQLAPPWVPRVITGTYDLPLKYLKEVGFDVRAVWPESGIQTGNLKQTVSLIDQAITSALYKGPAVAVGHSFGGEALKYWAKENPEKAKKLKAIYLGGSPLPLRFNSIVGEVLMFLQADKTPVGVLNELNDFERSSEAREINFISMIAEDDCILEGPPCGEVLLNRDGHSSMFYDINNLSEPVRRINAGDRNQPTVTKDLPRQSNIYQTTLPIAFAH